MFEIWVYSFEEDATSRSAFAHEEYAREQAVELEDEFIYYFKEI